MRIGGRHGWSGDFKTLVRQVELCGAQEQAIASMTRLLGHEEPGPRGRAFWALELLTPDAENILIRAFEGRELECADVDLLAGVKQRAVPRLLDALRTNADARVRRRCAVVLPRATGWSPRLAPSAVAAVIEALDREQDPATRVACLELLGHADPNSQEVTRRLKAALDDPDPKVAETAKWMLEPIRSRIP